MIKNVLKEDFYRLKYSKTLWICLSVSAAFAVLIAFFTKLAVTIADEFMPGNFTISPENVGGSVFLSVSVPLFVMIFAAVMVAGEFGAGTLRQILASGANRISVYFAKFLKVLVVSVWTFAAVFVFGYLTALLIWPSEPDLLGMMFCNLGFQLLSLAGFCSFYVSLAFLLRSIGGVIGVGIGINMFVSLLSQFSVSGALTVVNKLTISGAVENITNVLDPTVSDVMFAVFVPIGYVLLFGIVGMLNFVSRDVK